MTNFVRFISLATTLSAGLISAPSPLNCQAPLHRVQNIVLVHGALADGSGWKGVYDILTKDGYKVSIVQEPETSLHSKTDRVSYSATAMAAL